MIWLPVGLTAAIVLAWLVLTVVFPRIDNADQAALKTVMQLFGAAVALAAIAILWGLYGLARLVAG
jgi:hypothetical protein